MMNDTVLLASMRRAGIPKEALATTLAKEGLMPLRHYVMREVHTDKTLLYLQARDELPFYLVAKELVLSGKKVACLRLVDIHTALFSDKPEADEISALLEESDAIAVGAFVDKGGRSMPFLTPYECAYFVSWFIRNHQNGKVFVLQGSSSLGDAIDWWPESFIRYISTRAVIHKEGK